MAIDNPNPRASIGIICTHAFFYYVQKSIYENLENVEFILDFTSAPVPVGLLEYPEHYKEHVRDFFSKKTCYWRDFEMSGLSPTEFLGKYTTLVAPYYGGLITHKSNEKRKKVKVFYGIAKDVWAAGLYNIYFDQVLTASDFFAEKISELYKVKTYVTGDPKYDALKSELPVDFLERNNIHLDPSKKSILYVPTWGSLSSESRFLSALSRFAKNFNIIYKPHHMTYVARREEIENLRKNSPFVVLDDSVNLMDLLRLDVTVVSDNSSSIFDTLVAGRPIVLLEIFENTSSDLVESPFFYKDDKFAGAQTSNESLEQVIKQEGKRIAPVVDLSRPMSIADLEKEFLSAVDSAAEERYVLVQKKFVSEHLQNTDGESGKRAAEYISQTKGEESLLVREFRRYLEEYKKQTIMSIHERDELGNKIISDIKNMPHTKKVKAILELFF